MGRRGILRRAGIGLALGTIATLGIVPGTAVAQEGCAFQTIVNRSRNGNDGMVNGTVYQGGEVVIFRGSKRLGVQFLSGDEVLYHQRVKAIPSKTSLRVLMDGQLDIDVVARRAGTEPIELSYQYDCLG